MKIILTKQCESLTGSVGDVASDTTSKNVKTASSPSVTRKGSYRRTDIGDSSSLVPNRQK